MSRDNRLVRVLVADDSRAVVESLQRLINQAPDMLVVGTAHTGRDTVTKALALKPDLITMDVTMPEGDGISATREIMARQPTPIAVITAKPGGPSSDTMFQALAAGAVDVLPKLDHTALQHDPQATASFLQQLRNIACVGVVGIRGRRRGGERTSLPRQKSDPAEGRADSPATSLTTAPRLFAIGASTGGPPCIRGILAQLDPKKAPPVLVVQHMNSYFVEGFASWLNDTVEVIVRLARDGESLEPGVVYVAPGDRHMTLDAQYRIALSSGALVNGHRPAVDPMFLSIARHAHAQAVGVLLTGMGSDGAQGLAAMRNAGCVTLAQDESSSLVYGMPKAAADLDAAAFIANPLHIGRMLRQPKLVHWRSARTPREADMSERGEP